MLVISKLPELERVRGRRVAAKEALRVDTSHPPTHLRIAFVKIRASHEARIYTTRRDHAIVGRFIA